MENHSPGFIKIIVLLISVIAGLLISGIDLRELIADFDIKETATNVSTRAQEIYDLHLAELLQRFVYTPAVTLYTYIKVYVIDVVVSFIERVLA